MRKAVVVGIDHYDNMPGLLGCVSDARSVIKVLERHGDGAEAVNFDVKAVLGTGPKDAAVDLGQLRDVARSLFADEAEVSLFYFAGHGYIENIGGYICASDSWTGYDGLSLTELVSLANHSKAHNKIIILDSCHSGAAGVKPSASMGQQSTELNEGITILTASKPGQYSRETGGTGMFTGLLVDALSGAAANLLGAVTPASVYAHIDQSLGPWEQRPVFKSNVCGFVSLRQTRAPLVQAELRRISEFFPKPEMEFPLDPTYEPVRNGGEPKGTPPPNKANNEKFAVLQKYNRVNLVVPVGVTHMYDAAMKSTGCRLTPLGEHYRQLAARGRI